MSNYSFDSLLPSDFEELCRDLLEPYLGVKLKAFTNGPDKGIDLRHTPAHSIENSFIKKPWIVQCKHYAGSRFSDLKKAIKKEIPKIQQLNPERYVVATSLGLTPPNVDTLLQLLHPYCKSQEDILGKTDLNQLLSQHPEIEQRHPKLWVTSEAVLQQVLHNDIFQQSALTREAIEKRLKLYVYTDRYRDASKTFNDHHVAVIAGPPGVGKTTLAEMLILDYLREGWELVRARKDVDEAYKLYSKEPMKKQIFYYDDFLGQVSSREKLSKNEDSAIVDFVRSVSKTKHKRFILTAREYILAQARTVHERLTSEEFDIFKFVIECEDYDDFSKAHILANHLYFQNVPRRHIRYLVDKNRYKKIVWHRNYSPRIIETMTKPSTSRETKPSRFFDDFLGRLDNPEELWKPAFENQISEAARHLVVTLATLGEVALDRLEQEFKNYYQGRCKLYHWQYHPNSFRKACEELDGDFIQFNNEEDESFDFNGTVIKFGKREAEVSVVFSNPSLIDYVGNYLRDNSSEVSDILKTCNSFEQISSLGNKLHVLVPLRNEASVRFHDESALSDAIVRCFESKPIGMWWLYNLRRLNFCLELCKWHENGPVRKTTLTLLSNNVEKLEWFRDLGDAIDVSDSVTHADWIPDEQRQKLNQTYKQCFLHEDSYDGENIDDLRKALDWVGGHDSQFSVDEMNEVRVLIENAIQADVEAQLSDHGNDEDVIGGLLHDVEEIAREFELDLYESKSMIESRFNEMPTYDDRDDDGVPSSRHTAEASRSIDGLFDSLLQ